MLNILFPYIIFVLTWHNSYAMILYSCTEAGSIIISQVVSLASGIYSTEYKISTGGRGGGGAVRGGGNDFDFLE
jgi:hypothetical protein